MMIHFDLWDFDGNYAYAEYLSFRFVVFHSQVDKKRAKDHLVLIRVNTYTNVTLQNIKAFFGTS